MTIDTKHFMYFVVCSHVGKTVGCRYSKYYIKAFKTPVKVIHTISTEHSLNAPRYQITTNMKHILIYCFRLSAPIQIWLDDITLLHAIRNGALL